MVGNFPVDAGAPAMAMSPPYNGGYYGYYGGYSGGFPVAQASYAPVSGGSPGSPGCASCGSNVQPVSGRLSPLPAGPIAQYP
jgi:hypothetical protein